MRLKRLKQSVQLHVMGFEGHFWVKINAAEDWLNKCAWQPFSRGNNVGNLITSGHWRRIHNARCERLDASRLSTYDPLTLIHVNSRCVWGLLVVRCVCFPLPPCVCVCFIVFPPPLIYIIWLHVWVQCGEVSLEYARLIFSWGRG